jgi:putative sigma-54 modulation protein
MFKTRKNRKSVRADVKLSEFPGNKNDKYKAEVVLHLTSAQLTAVESTLNMYAAIDIVEAKLKNQLRKYKERHQEHKKIDRKNVFRRLREKSDRDFWGRQN